MRKESWRSRVQAEALYNEIWQLEEEKCELEHRLDNINERLLEIKQKGK